MSFYFYVIASAPEQSSFVTHFLAFILAVLLLVVARGGQAWRREERSGPRIDNNSGMVIFLESFNRDEGNSEMKSEAETAVDGQLNLEGERGAGEESGDDGPPKI